MFFFSIKGIDCLQGKNNKKKENPVHLLCSIIGKNFHPQGTKMKVLQSESR
jgi:hypothetical protein